MLLFIQTQWNLIAAHPVTFITLSALTFAGGLKVGSAFAQRQIAILREQLALKDMTEGQIKGSHRLPAMTLGTYQYPEHGFHGMNVLAPIVSAVTADEAYSMSANVPADKELRIRLSVVHSDSAESTTAAWKFEIGVLNWQHRLYDNELSEQWFVAGHGKCDMKITFCRSGTIRIAVYEGEANEPSRVRQILVKAKAG